MLNDKLKVLCDVVHVISINIDIDIASLASLLASQFLLSVFKYKTLEKVGFKKTLLVFLPTESLHVWEGNMVILIVMRQHFIKGCGILSGLCSHRVMPTLPFEHTPMH